MSELDLGLGVLDHQLVDADGRNCGKVDDLELDLEQPQGPRVVAILSGSDAWRGRGRLGRKAAALAGPGVVCVPWEQVREVEASVRLRSSADDLGLGRGDTILGPLIERLPGGRL
jgi:sporulation protein YlmC with PRC-barrel domain